MQILKKILWVYLTGFFVNSVVAQQLPLFTQYREYHSFINPASASSDYFTQEYNLVFGASYRKEWVGLAESPSSTFFKGEYIHRSKSSFDLSIGGFLLERDTDPIHNTGVYGKIAALFSEDPYFGAFSVGFTFGALQYQIKTMDLNPANPNDLLLQGGNQQQIAPDVGIGLFYYKQLKGGIIDGDVLYGGISVPQILGQNVAFEDGVGINFQQKPHLFAVAGYYKYLNQESFIEYSTWLKHVTNSPFQMDVNTRYQHRRIFWAGVGFSTSKIIHTEFGLYLGNRKQNSSSSFKISYSFDFSVASYGALFGSSHELNASYILDTR